MKITATIFLATFLTASGNAPVLVSAPVAPTYTFETAVKERFADPDTVQFRNLSHGSDGRSICGEVNGVDRHGDYVGFQRFAVFGGNGGYMVLLANDGGSNAEKLVC